MQIQMEGEEGGNWICKGKGNYNQDILYIKKVKRKNCAFRDSKVSNTEIINF